MVDTTQTPDNPPEQIDDQARSWVIKLDSGEIGPENRARLEQWLQSDVAHQQAFDDASQAWSSIDALAADTTALPDELKQLVGAELEVDIDSIVAPPGVEFLDQPPLVVLAEQPVPNAEEQPDIQVQARPINDLKQTRLLGARQLASAAVLLLMISLGVYQWMPLPEGHYRTNKGQQLTHQLQDGSTLTLNTDSYAVVDFSQHTRQIILRQGEAYFSVAHDKSRPFIVEADGGKVTAVGTAFNVYLQQDQVDVTVTEGVVEVAALDTPPSGPAQSLQAQPANDHLTQRLQLHQSLVYGNKSGGLQIGRVTQRDASDVDQRLAWRSHKLYFDNASLAAFVTQLNRYSDRYLVIMDPGLKDLRVGGVFKTGDTDTALAALETSFDVEAVNLTPYLTLLYKKDTESL